ncbi:MAG: VWA domain-containing protein [Planctomycetota bacterium]
MLKTLLILPTVLWLLGDTADPLALFKRWRNSPSAALRMQAVRSLRGREGPSVRVALLSCLGDADPRVRAAARTELVALAPDQGPTLARGIAGLRSAAARREGVRAVIARKEDATLFVADKDPEVRARALASRRVTVPALQRALRHADGKTRALALEALGDADRAQRATRDRDEQVRIAAARVSTDPAVLEHLLFDRSWRVRLAAVRATERMRKAALVPALIERLDREEGRLHARVLRALERLTQAAPGPDARAWRRWWESLPADYRLADPKPAAPRGHSEAMVTFGRIPVVSKRVCFVLDLSRSMAKPAPGKRGRTRWELVREDLRTVLRKLPSGTRLNVVLFRTGVEAWRPRLVRASPAAVRSCLDWIGKAEPAGWTNLYDAVALALRMEDVDTLYILTDGVPSRGTETGRAQILSEIAFLNHYRLVEINCVQAGSRQGLGKTWDGFLEDLARAHDGVSVRE